MKEIKAFIHRNKRADVVDVLGTLKSLDILERQSSIDT